MKTLQTILVLLALVGSLPAAIFQGSSPFWSRAAKITNAQSDSIAVPHDAIIYETFNRPNQQIQTGNFTTESGHAMFFSVASPYTDPATNTWIENGKLVFKGTNTVGGYNTYMWGTVPWGPRFITGIRCRAKMWNASATASFSAGVTFTCSQNSRGGSFWSPPGEALHNQFINGDYGNYWACQRLTNGVDGGYNLLAAERPWQVPALQTNEWKVLEWGFVSESTLFMSVNGWRTNLTYPAFANAPRTNFYWQVGGHAGTSISQGLYTTFEIDSFWVRRVEDSSFVDTDRLAVKISTNNNAGEYRMGDSEVFHLTAGNSNVYLPGGTWIGDQWGNNGPRTPYAKRMVVIVDGFGNAAGTNIHVWPARYTNVHYFGTFVTNFAQDNINGSTNRQLITTARGALRLLCNGTNWVSW